MKKVAKIVGIIFLMLVILGIIFYTVDKNRAREGQKPIFCIRTSIYKDGGTKIYYGLGYKVIAFNKLEGYNEIKVGPWSMQYEDFKEEYEKEPIYVEITGYDIESKLVIRGEDILNLLKSLKYTGEVCDGIVKYTIKLEDGTTYYIKSDCNGVVKDGKQAEISNVGLEILEDIIESNKNVEQTN